MKYPTRFQQRTVWSAVTGIAILVLGSLLVGLVWLVGQIFGFLQPVLVPLIVAGIIAYLLDPIVRLIEKRGLSRLWSVISVFIAILVVVTLLVVAVLPAIQGGKNFFRGIFAPSVTTESVAGNNNTGAVEESAEPEPNLVPALARSLYNLRNEHREGPVGWMLTETNLKGEAISIDTKAESPETLDFFWQTRAGKILFKYKDELIQTGTRWISVGSSKILGLFGLILGMIMVPVYLFFFLNNSVSIHEHWHEYVPLRTSQFKTELVETLQEINGYLISFFRGQMLVAAIDGILVGVALYFFNLPYALLVGVFMAILGFIPYIGNILCLIPACIIAYLHAQTGTSIPFDLEPWPYVGCVVLIFAGVQQINSLLTAPKIVGDSVGLHPLTVIFSMLFWSVVLGGFVGALLAVPLTAAVKVILRRYFWEKKLRESEAEPVSEPFLT
jgi:predicted PurR-regulated permease PerM